MAQDLPIKWTMRKHPDQTYTGEVYIPGEWSRFIPGAPAGQSYIKATSSLPVSKGGKGAPTSAGAALSQASGIASQIANNPLLQAALPPGAGVAVAAIDYLAKNETVGNLANAAKDIVGDGAKRIADVLKFW